MGIEKVLMGFMKPLYREDLLNYLAVCEVTVHRRLY